MWAAIKQHTFQFKVPGGTSRGVLHTKDSWYLRLWHEDQPNVCGIGECSIIRGLSPDDHPDFRKTLTRLVEQINNQVAPHEEELKHFPAIRFGLEMANNDLVNGGQRLLFPSDFTSGKATIPINGLIWMGQVDFMKAQIEEKLKQGFTCLKLKIGAIDFEEELNLLQKIRKHYDASCLELRVDANGAFTQKDALKKMEQLSALHIHSIEQPLKPGQWELMADLCEQTPLPIALDEELIGVTDRSQKQALLAQIKPQYIILKPSLTGGFRQSEEWIQLAQENQIAWWVTSALEGNIGLNAIAQWTYTLNNKLPQGLGTGQVFTNNIPSPLEVDNGNLKYNPRGRWGNPFKE
jgi:o-succinylbenzoate synthase